MSRKIGSSESDVMDILDFQFDDSLVDYPVRLISQLDELSVEIPEGFLGLHKECIEKLCEIKYYLTYRKKCIDLIVERSILDEDLTLIDNYVELAFNDSNEIHDVVVSVGNIFYHTWLKDYDYEDSFLSFIDKKNRNGDKYINFMSSFIAGFVSNDHKNDYVNLINLCFSEEIKGNSEASYAICKSVGFLLYEQSYAPFRAANDLLNKIKMHNSVRLSKASSRPKSRDYNEVISIVKNTIDKHSNASVSSLIEKIHIYYSLNNRKPPAKNTIRSWIADIGYKPKGKPVNNYNLVTKTDRS